MSYTARDLVLDAMDWRVRWPQYGLCTAIPWEAQWNSERGIIRTPTASASAALMLFQNEQARDDYWWSFDAAGQAARDLALCFILAMVEDEC